MLGPYLSELDPAYAGDYPFLDLYWTQADRHPLLIEAQGEVAGFALVNKVAQTEHHVDHVVAEFYVMPRFRRRGIGLRAASRLLRQGRGIWEVAVLREAPRALAFWRRTIGSFAPGQAIPYFDAEIGRWLFRFGGQYPGLQR